MIALQHRSTIGSLVVLVALVASACSQGAASASPNASAVASATGTAAATATSAPTASPTRTPTPTSKPTAKPTPSPKPTPCPVKATSGKIPSDRLVDVKTATGADADTLTFVFGNMSVPGPGGPPTGALDAAKPPFTYGPSGLPIVMVGEHVVQVVFRGMSIVADTGDPVYTGPAEVSPGYPALKHAVEFDESEGQVGWYVGYDGPGCVTLATTGNDITLTFAH